MGKRDKKQRHQHRTSHRAAFHYTEEGEEGVSFESHAASKFSLSEEEEEEEVEKKDEVEDEAEIEETEETDKYPSKDMPSKFLLYQQSVQSPKGDISYLQKFFLMYVGGRQPLHLQEDFCGTALLSAEWLRTDSRRTAVGLDLDLEALEWCMENNINKIGSDGYSRISLFHGNVLQPLEAKLIEFEPQELIRNISLSENKDVSESGGLEGGSSSPHNEKYMRNHPLPARDIVCAFNYSCCCLHRRAELVLYFKHVLDVLSKKGGIFVMDLYGGTSSECKLRLQRKFANFTYFWEQAEFDIIERKTRISLHFHLKKQQKKLRHAFSYSWRLWSLPEIKDCLEEAGFQSVHFWLREMQDTREIRKTEGFGVGRDIKYEEVTKFQQQDAWNAYVVAVA
ncbi:putative S-adenosyl-L-methionine-dependent methyltransferase [Rosa chinensis]|uniref:Putative S-adenosyl-L-methionine-dependent methyltransferase n=1 Tax=Rosa chinensis TaxID=74649 RepID=A0A2P6QDI9_ROSCH|nr:uncharacterized protein LOC112168005 [Rosa chinensis]PRQ32241.1 putative S-adenosyl-L-methionine-dependent methyltransferase [Rosa chinensis]